MKSKYSTLRRKHQEIHDKEESEVWRWYFEVKSTPKHFRQKKSLLWKHYDWIFNNERFVNKRAGYEYDIFTSNNLLEVAIRSIRQ